MQKKKTKSVSHEKSKIPSSSIQLELYKGRADIIQKTAQQVQKDFGQFGVDIHFSGNAENAYDELFKQLVEHLDLLQHNNSEKLMALLYQIDVTEKSIFETEKVHPDWTHIEVMTELILYRELKKVVMRTYIKENPDWLD